MSKTIPGLSDRIKAFIMDGIVLVIFMFIAFKIIDSYEDVTTMTRKVVFLCILLVYDPLFTSFGGTIGHRAFNLRVKRESNPEKNIWFIAAVFRFAIKLLLGWISLLTIQSSSKGQAIHDMLTASTVIYKKSLTDDDIPYPTRDQNPTEGSNEIDQLNHIEQADELEDAL